MMSGELFSLPSNPTRSTLLHVQDPNSNPNPSPNSNPSKKKRNLPGNPDPSSEVITLSPKSLMATNRFICEICNKGFQRDQNLQLHRRGHNLPWKLKQRTNKDPVRKKVYVCPEKSCLHHDPCRALGDLTGIKKHYSRKHGEKKWKCEKCSKKYAVQSDWKAHSKICGTREYKCDCGTLFSRKDSFVTHRSFCDTLTQECVKVPSAISNLRSINLTNNNTQVPRIPQSFPEFHSEFGGNSVSEALEINYANNSHQLHCFPGKLSAFSSNANTVPCTHMSDLVETMNMFGSTPQQTQWLNYQASFTNGNNNNLSMPLSALLPHGLKQEQEENKQDLSHTAANSVYFMSATSLFNTDNSSSTFNNNNNNHNVFEGGFSMDDSSSNNNKDQLGLTRDFLGVGDESITISRPFDLAEFNAMGSAMEVNNSHYDGHYC
ncbi:PREDICTED: protein indeterminate-domain 9-like isoform X2 [Lupinus angustifolius]|uniref:protein indeterminate-domain 9-like isoform X2 n=1 Tax=Lupinus angustifolius TaxID=3871 RepID=UPI00092FD4AC|nr:PREDICTED: protein indeterminate-domain 9-like isoform X2 [Lupinus angustifolius]